MRLQDFTEKEKELKKKMKRSKIFEKDIKEKFIKSSGPGGQNVNKLSSCVYLEHIPTGISVKCQKERSQAMNRHTARWTLVDKIEKKKKEEKDLIIREIQKKKRANRKRSTKSKEETLQKKHIRSEKKSSRKKIRTNDIAEYI